MNAPANVAVVDASLALKWVLNEPDSPVARVLIERWATAGIQPIAPSWFACEVSNILFQHVRGGRLTLIEAQERLAVVMDVVGIESSTTADALRAIEIADLAGQRASYDAQYAALAERLGCELWTADDRFRDAVRAIVPQVRSLSEIA